MWVSVRCARDRFLVASMTTPPSHCSSRRASIQCCGACLCCGGYLTQNKRGINMRSPSSSFLLLFGLATFTGTGCGEDKPPVAADAKVEPKDAPSPTVDADIPNPSWDEGGGALAEYQRIFCNPNAMPPVPNCTPEGIIYQARLTTFYWKQHTPARYPFPVNPGCNKTGMETPTTDADDIFPFGMATGHHEYLDVGTPILTGGAMQANITPGPNPGFDGFHRAQDGIYHFLVDRAGGDVYLSNYDSFYSLVLTGSS